MKKTIKEKTHDWLLNADILEEIPLRVMWPGDDESFSFHLLEDSNELGSESSNANA